jgi:hypothetical protein
MISDLKEYKQKMHKINNSEKWFFQKNTKFSEIKVF